ncbi:Uncharacterized protein FWK35_00025260 [Aphis craccivora]|uniref:Uncharacterized protein n=1 Tax=Aphis craccivora TaxID=307492 RepID=A0A6G0Y6R9_APHCR|nr:Uncharacterized protein FWK35_00025260 [Aphis craccivora]
MGSLQSDRGSYNTHAYKSVCTSGYPALLYIRCRVDSERSEECIDFTMIITSRNNAPISNYGGGFRCKSDYP